MKLNIVLHLLTHRSVFIYRWPSSPQGLVLSAGMAPWTPGDITGMRICSAPLWIPPQLHNICWAAHAFTKMEQAQSGLEPENWMPISSCPCTVILAGEMCYLGWAAKQNRQASHALYPASRSSLLQLPVGWTELQPSPSISTCSSFEGGAALTAPRASAEGRGCVPPCCQWSLNCLSKLGQWGIFP